MEPVKRKAHKNAVVTNLLTTKRVKIENVQVAKTQTIATQTKDILPVLGQFFRLIQPKKWSLNKVSTKMAIFKKPNSSDKACQTHKPTSKSTDFMPMESLMKTMSKRRLLSIDADRALLKKLLEQINADPPPSWHTASLMWLDVDVLERRIEEFEKEQAENKEPAKKGDIEK